MNIGFWVCAASSIVFLLLALLFTLLKGKAAILISGFSTMPKEQRRLYDTKWMSKDHRNMFLIWTAILGVGALLSLLISTYIAIPAFIVWIIMFFKDVHLDEEKAFGKYKF